MEAKRRAMLHKRWEQLMAEPWGSKYGMIPEPSDELKRAHFEGFLIDSEPHSALITKS